MMFSDSFGKGGVMCTGGLKTKGQTDTSWNRGHHWKIRKILSIRNTVHPPGPFQQGFAQSFHPPACVGIFIYWLPFACAISNSNFTGSYSTCHLTLDSCVYALIWLHRTVWVTPNVNQILVFRTSSVCSNPICLTFLHIQWGQEWKLLYNPVVVQFICKAEDITLNPSCK